MSYADVVYIKHRFAYLVICVHIISWNNFWQMPRKTIFNYCPVPKFNCNRGNTVL